MGHILDRVQVGLFRFPGDILSPLPPAGHEDAQLLAADVDDHAVRRIEA